MLDKYWPNSTELNCIKRIPSKAVYTAMYGGNEVIVKSITYTPQQYQNDLNQAEFLNFIGEEVSVANYIEPSVELSDDEKLVVTVSRFAPGVSPLEVPPNAPNTWIFDEPAVRAEAQWWSDYRQRAIEFRSAYPDSYENWIEWD